MHDRPHDIGAACPAGGAGLNDEPRQRSPSADLALELVAVYTVAASLIGLVAALVGVFQAPQVLLAALLIASAYCRWTRGRRVASTVAPSGFHLLLIVIVTLFFRVPAYHYVLGGQDEGVYVNMAAHLIRSGNLTPADPVLQKLRQPAAIERYLADNYESRSYLPGVYRLPGNPPRLQFQFFHLFPVWMALFGGVYGLGASVYALTFLALVSVAFLYRLALALTGSRVAALIAGLLIAVNPLHAFFSKFPLTEVATLAFSAMGFTFLALYCIAIPAARSRRSLVVAALALLCVFTMRVSGFFYLPFLLLLSTGALAFDPDAARRLAVHRWVLIVIALYALSIVYGLHWSGVYAGDVYRLSFQYVFGARWKLGLVAAALIALLGCVLLSICSGSSRARERLSRVATVGRNVLGPALLVAVLLSAYKAYQLGFTPRYSEDPILGLRYRLAAAGWRGAAEASLVVASEYLCPLLFVTFLVLMLRRWREPRVEVILAFLSWFVVHFALLDWVLPYQPYYARYLVSELVPYTILFVVCVWAFAPQRWLKSTLSGVLLVSGAYGTALSAAQIGKNENQKAYESIARIAAPVDDRDLLLIDSDHIGGFAVSELKTPLVYTFGRDVADISRSSLADTSYLAELRASHGDVYLVSCAASPPDGFVPIDALPFKVLAYRHGIEPPLRTYWRIDAHVYLYQLQRLEMPTGVVLQFGTHGGTWNDWLESNWSVLEDWGVWAVGHSATLRLAVTADKRGEAVGRARLWLKGFVSRAKPEQRVTIRVDGNAVQELRFRYPDATDLQADVPLPSGPVSRSQRITIEFVMPDAVSPESVGLSADTRVLGVGIERLELLEGHGERLDQVDTRRHRP